MGALRRNLMINDLRFRPIVFEDANVKAICVANWGGNYISGEITEYEAAQVTTLGGNFASNKDIITFDELKYFTGLTTLYYVYQNNGYNGQLSFCDKLNKITLPAAPISNWGGAFRQTPASGDFLYLDMTPITAQSVRLNAPWRETYRLKELILPGITYTGTMQYGFRNCQQLTTIDIVGTADFSSVTSYNNCFYNVSRLTTITGNIVGLKFDLDFSYSSQLTRDSCLVILNGLYDFIGNGSSIRMTIKFHANALNNLAKSDIAIATQKGWTISGIVPIVFEDSAVKQLCVSNWGDNFIDNEITEFEAQQITTLGTTFNGNTTITAFNELEKFTKLTTLANAFTNCTSLTKVKVPKAPLTTLYQTFMGCTSLTSVDIPNDQSWKFVQNGLSQTFSGCTALTGSLDLSSVKSYTNSYVSCYAVVHSTKITSIVMPYTTIFMDSCFVNAHQLVTIDTTGCRLTTTGSNRLRNIIGANSTATVCNSLTTITNGIPNANLNLDLAYAPLTHDSALAVINNLATVSTTQTLTFSSATYATLTTDEIAIATAKNWTVNSRG